MAARLLLAIALVVSIWPLLGSGAAHACQPFRGSVEQAVGISGELSLPIFVGTVLTSEEPDRDHQVHVFAVERYLLGDGPRQLTIVSKPICRKFYTVGDRYLTAIRTTNLDRLSPAEADERISDMEAAVLAEYGSLGTFTDDPIPPWATAASFGVAILAGAGLLLGVRRLASR